MTIRRRVDGHIRAAIILKDLLRALLSNFREMRSGQANFSSDHAF